jgi:hypothetical protein
MVRAALSSCQKTGSARWSATLAAGSLSWSIDRAQGLPLISRCNLQEPVRRVRYEECLNGLIQSGKQQYPE